MTTKDITPAGDNGMTLNEIIADLAWQVEQPNSHPLELYTPLIEAIGRRLYGPNSGAREDRVIERLGLPNRELKTSI